MMKIPQTPFTFFFSCKLALNLDQFKLTFPYFLFLALPLAMLSFLAFSLLIISVILEEGTHLEERTMDPFVPVLPKPHSTGSVSFCIL